MISTEKTTIVDIDPRTITLKQAREITAAVINGFSVTDLYQSMWGADYTFLERPIPKERLPKYNALLTVNTWSIWQNMRNENIRCFSAVQDGKPVGFCMWRLPDGEQTNHLSWWHKMVNYLIGVWIKVLHLWYFGSGPNPTHMPANVKERVQEWQQERFIVHDDPDLRRAELSKMPCEEYTEACLLQQDYYWCMIMSVDTAYQGQGIGGQLFREGIKRLRTRDILLNGIVKPAKLGLIATREGRISYEKVGFEPCGSLQCEHKGRKFVGTPMQKTLTMNRAIL